MISAERISDQTLELTFEIYIQTKQKPLSSDEHIYWVGLLSENNAREMLSELMITKRVYTVSYQLLLE